MKEVVAPKEKARKERHVRARVALAAIRDGQSVRAVEQALRMSHSAFMTLLDAAGMSAEYRQIMNARQGKTDA